MVFIGVYCIHICAYYAVVYPRGSNKYQGNAQNPTIAFWSFPALSIEKGTGSIRVSAL